MSPTRRRQVTTTRNRVTIGATVLAVLLGTAVVTRTVASADTAPGAAPAACAAEQGPVQGQAAPAAAESPQPAQPLSPGARWLQRRGESVDHHGVRNVWGDGQAPPAPSPAGPSPSDSAEPTPSDSAEPTPSDSAEPTPSAATPADAKPTPSPTCSTPPAQSAQSAQPARPALDILGNSCKGSGLTPHDGFQEGNRCVSTEFGEVGLADKNPSLLITSAPRAVRVDQFFDLKISTRNLVRDRFLKAAQGGYYKESSFLTADGLVRGHFHTACRMLTATSAAPDPAPAPAFFVATEDGKGGAQPDTVTIRVLGLPQAGRAQCAVWAGDGSHRVPMMQRANQIPAFDVVRIRVF